VEARVRRELRVEARRQEAGRLDGVGLAVEPRLVAEGWPDLL
jgi:hypothetical protein